METIAPETYGISYNKDSSGFHHVCGVDPAIGAEEVKKKGE